MLMCASLFFCVLLVVQPSEEGLLDNLPVPQGFPKIIPDPLGLFSRTTASKRTTTPSTDASTTTTSTTTASTTTTSTTTASPTTASATTASATTASPTTASTTLATATTPPSATTLDTTTSKVANNSLVPTDGPRTGIGSKSAECPSNFKKDQAGNCQPSLG